MSIKWSNHSRSIIPKLERRIFTWSTKSEPVAYSVSNPTAKPNIAHLFDQHARYRTNRRSISKSCNIRKLHRDLRGWALWHTKFIHNILVFWLLQNMLQPSLPPFFLFHSSSFILVLYFSFLGGHWGLNSILRILKND